MKNYMTKPRCASGCDTLYNICAYLDVVCTRATNWTDKMCAVVDAPVAVTTPKLSPDQSSDATDTGRRGMKQLNRYRVTHHVRQNLPLTSTGGFDERDV